MDTIRLPSLLKGKRLKEIPNGTELTAARLITFSQARIRTLLTAPLPSMRRNTAVTVRWP